MINDTNDLNITTTTLPPLFITEPIERNLIDTIEIYILSICFLIGAPLNLISFYKLSKSFRQSKKSSSARSTTSSQGSGGNSQINLLRIHLNIADLMTLFIYTTAQIGWLLTTQWLGGDILCRIIKFFYTFVFYLTSFVIVCIAVDRVFGAYKLSSFKASKKAFLRCKKMLCIAWAIACLLSLPQLYIFGVVSPPDMPGFRQCAPIWMSMKSQLEHRASYPSVSNYEKAFLYEQYLEIIRWETFYNICHLLFVFWLPATVIAISYISILCILKSFSRQPADVFDEMTSRTSIFSMIFSTTKNARVKLAEQNSNSSTYNEIEPEDVTTQSLPGIVLKQNAITPKRSCENLKRLGSSMPERRSLMFCTPVQRYYQRSQSEQLKPIVLNKNSVSSQQNSSRSNSKIGPLALQTIALARQKTKKQAAFILIAYLTLWTPYNLFAIINIFIPTDSRGYFLNRIMDFTPFLNSLIVVNSLVNPLIYGVFDRVPA